MTTTPSLRLLANREEVGRVALSLARAPRISFDLESNGLFAYRARVCTVQLATDEEIFVVDTQAVDVRELGELLSSPTTVKIVHDVSFDARVLAEFGVTLANVEDTSIAARMLGRTSTGLASLLSSELGISIDKKMQHHDWSERPITKEALAYLGGDVIHLPALADGLFGACRERGILDAVHEETRYRLGTAAASVTEVDPRPPYVRLKGIDRVPPIELPILRRLAEIREKKARELDVPPYKVIGPDLLFAIAAKRPRTRDELAAIRGATSGRARALANDMLRAVEAGLADDGLVPEEDRALLDPPRPPKELTKARRAREQRLTAWRKAQAKAREVDEQVVLPGHCLQDLASLEAPSLEALAAVPGIGAFRVARDADAILAALEGSSSAIVEEDAR